MTNLVKPKIVVSKCIEFDYCRYNGQIIRSEFVAELKPFVDFIPICPEVEIGLGTPRSPIRIISKDNQKFLIQPITNLDVSNKMQSFTKHFLASLKGIDGFILKSRSPSCGLNQVKIYPPGEKKAPIAHGAGFFGEQVKELFPFAAIEDESRMNNNFIREHFLRKIFTFANFRSIQNTKRINELIQFHSENKFLFMAYNQKRFRELGTITANHEKKPITTVLNEYAKCLNYVFYKAPRCTSNINVLHHIFGFFSKDITAEEKKFFLELVDKYRNGKTSLAAVSNLLKSWSLRFNQTYILKQSFFEPYPAELQHIENIDSCNVRDFWE